MHYFRAPFHKVLLFVSLTGALIVLVSITFLYKDIRYGSENLTTVVTRVATQKLSELYYRVRFQSGSLVAAAATTITGNTSVSSEKRAQAIPVLLYHGLRQDRDEYAVPPHVFADQMYTLHRAGWDTITLAEFEAYLRGEIELPERSFLLTFDDGAKASYYPVDPVLAALNMEAVSFILPKYSGDGGTTYYLSAGEIRGMLESGRWEIGSHGQDSHEILPVNGTGDVGAALANRIWLPEEGRIETRGEYQRRVARDLSTSRDDLENLFARPIYAFAFPFGEFGHLSANYTGAEDVVRSLAEEMYRVAFYQTWAGEGFSFNYVHDAAGGMLFAKRIEVRPGMTAEEVLAKLENGLPKELPYRDDFSEERGWFANWGQYDSAEDDLYLKSTSGETGNAVVLDGTKHWQNYRLEATVHSPNGTGVVVWVRFKDNDNNAACNFGNGFIHAEEVVDGERNVAQGTREGVIRIPSGTFTVEAEVTGRTLTCTLNGTYSVTTPFLNRNLERGGVGFKIWDPEPGVAELTVHTVVIESLE